MPLIPRPVKRTGSTLNGHLAVWNGDDTGVIKDGGAIPSPGITNSATANTTPVTGSGGNLVELTNIANGIGITDLVYILQNDMVVTGIGAGVYTWRGQNSDKSWYQLLNVDDSNTISSIIFDSVDAPDIWAIFDGVGLVVNTSANDVTFPSQASWTGSTVTAVPATKLITEDDLAVAILGGLDRSDVGLGNVDNTSDANKPISTATQTVLDAKASLAIVTNSTPTTGQTINASTGKLDETLYITPAGTLLALTVSLPTSANSRVWQIIRGFISQIITGLTVNVAGSGTVIGATPITSAVNSTFAYQCVSVAGNGTWIRIQ